MRSRHERPDYSIPGAALKCGKPLFPSTPRKKGRFRGRFPQLFPQVLLIRTLPASAFNLPENNDLTDEFRALQSVDVALIHIGLGVRPHGRSPIDFDERHAASIR
jgi:hypothetical protein